MAEFTPMMRQYFEIKEKCPDYILMYRLGDFYEMFFEDAKIAAQELELTLTGRDCGQEERAPMCGVPYHSCEGYIARLVKKGYKIAICEQVEDPKTAKGLVRREIIRMITPGTVTESSMLDENRNNYIACVYMHDNQAGVCFADITTGDVYATGMEGKDVSQNVINELGRFVPSETIVNRVAGSDIIIAPFLRERIQCSVEYFEEDCFDLNDSLKRIEKQFSIIDLSSAGLEQNSAIVMAVGGLIKYLLETQMNDLTNLNHINVYKQGQFMELDVTAQRNLELCETMRTKEKKGSLLWVLDKTKTAMGARLIRQWVCKPLINPIQIQKRQIAIQELLTDLIRRKEISETLQNVFDIERLIGRIVYGTANCRDLRSLHMTLTALPAIKSQLKNFKSPLLSELYDRIDLLEDIRTLIDAAIVENPPFSVREGGFIRAGYSCEVDELRDAASGGKNKIAEIEQKERERTGIKNLKVGYNRVFGYYIEISKSNTENAPADYIRKQTLANCERYITEELKQYENTVLGAQDKLNALEYQLFCEVREQVASQVHRVQRTAQAISNLDVLGSLAEVSEQNGYACPIVDFSGKIAISDGRHPVVEMVLKDSMFIPNDTLLDGGENRVAVITGPNMAGKSTYMRQVALITIMAQMGSFVPAKSAHIGIVDRVFTRVGASDDLASGQSTFMVEMSEVAAILKHATQNSLLILDEIGRGTSTYDGMSIARAVVEYVADKKKVGARSLFATHYHELTALEDLVDGIKNYNIAVKKRGDDITFLRKIVRGGADDSYGIEVAKLAGVPIKVIERAKHILADLESEDKQAPLSRAAEEPQDQVSMEHIGLLSVAEKLKETNIDTLTPIEALNLVYALKRQL